MHHPAATMQKYALSKSDKIVLSIIQTGGVMKGNRRSIGQFVFAIMMIFGGQVLLADQLAFPGAEGFGAYAQGGRGGDVYYVTNTNDSGSGSLREGINSASGPRTIVFAVSGLIHLQSNLKVDNDNITIAGQTAPGDGICVRGYTFSISADDVIVRYIRSRLGDQEGQESDAMSITSGKNIILDHCSASWSVDEVFSCSTGTTGAIDNVTVQWSIISEGLGDSIHSKGYHSYGALIRGAGGVKYSYHHNLFAHNNGRNPRPGNYDENDYIIDPLGLQFDFRNNVMYNWGGGGPSYDADTDSVCRMNYVNNYAKAGPAGYYGQLYDTGSKHFMAYYEGNYWNGSIPYDQYSMVDFGSWSSAEIASWIQPVPFSTGPIVTQTAQGAYASVIKNVGASLARDSVDTRIVNEVVTGTVTYYGSVSGKPGIIDSQYDVGGWPVYNSTTPPTDTDQDGMPDTWETARGLNPSNPADRNDDRNSDGYTNLEEYLSWLTLDPEKTSWPIPADNSVVSTTSLRCSEVPNVSGYVFYYSTLLGDIENSVNPYPTSSPDVTGLTLSEGVQYYWRVDAIANDSEVLIGDVWTFVNNASTTQTSIKINFQPTSSSVPAGYLVDDGSVYASRGNGETYGWSSNNTDETRDRGDNSDQRYDTLCHLDGRSWEIDLDNGIYGVDLVCGDPSHTDQINHLLLEGTLVSDPDGGDNYDEYLGLSVTITDGKLTIVEDGSADNAKLCFIEISSAGGSGASLPVGTAPTGVSIALDSPDLEWISTDNPEYDKQDVYYGTHPDTMSFIGTVDYGDTNILTIPGTLELDTTYYCRVVARSTTNSSLNDISSLVWSFTTRDMICTAALPGDISGPEGEADCQVNIYDLRSMMKNWQKSNLWTEP